MINSTSKDTIILDEKHFLDVEYDSKDHILTAWMFTDTTPPVLVFNAKYRRNVNYVKKAVAECTKLIDAYDQIVGIT